MSERARRTVTVGRTGRSLDRRGALAGIATLTAAALAGASTGSARANSGDELLLGNAPPATPNGQTATATTRISVSVTTAPGFRVVNASGAGVVGEATASSFGVYGFAGGNSGVFGDSTAASGVHGETTVVSGANSAGVRGHAVNATGVRGTSVNQIGVRGESTANYGVYGVSLGSVGIYGNGVQNAGVFGTSPIYGVWGRPNTGFGVNGEAVGTGIGVYGRAPAGGFAGYFDGPVFIAGVGVLSAASGPLPLSARAGAAPEDMGEAQMVDGQATVTLAPEFAEAAKAGGYVVFLTEGDDLGGIYCAARGPSGFQVRARKAGAGGTFTYRVVLRKQRAGGQPVQRAAAPSIAMPKNVPVPTAPEMPKDEPVPRRPDVR